MHYNVCFVSSVLALNSRLANGCRCGSRTHLALTRVGYEPTERTVSPYMLLNGGNWIRTSGGDYTIPTEV